MRIALLVLFTLALLGLLEGGFHLLGYFSGRRQRELRRRLKATPGPGIPIKLDPQVLRHGRFASNHALDVWLSRRPFARALEHLLEQADSRMTVVQLCVLSSLGAVVGILAGFWLGLFPGLALAAAGLVGPGIFLARVREQRSHQITRELPEALDMMARSLRAGHSLPSAFELVSTEMPEPIAVEFARAFEEQKLGMALDRVVLEMSARAPSNQNLKLFAISAVIQRETGGNLAEILNGISNTIRERHRLYGKQRSLTAEARATAWFVSLVPIALFAFFFLTQRGYMQPLFNTPPGRGMFVFGCALWVLGALWFSKLTRFRY